MNGCCPGCQTCARKENGGCCGCGGACVCDTPTETVLEEAARLVSGDRGADYGHPLDNHGTTAELFTAYLRRKYGTLNEGVDAEDVCAFNIVQKLSRFANKPTRDCLVDIAGYAENIQRVLDERARRAS